MLEVFFNYKSYCLLKQTQKTPTEHELLLAGELIRLGLDFEPQVAISNTTVDGLIKEYFRPAKIIIEVDDRIIKQLNRWRRIEKEW
ncbi:hypothetical protein MUG87_14610 [Ectobacillus sp. JY-23]|uniref:hypothetical protein n=1 Tax=Ectobacillus sp. JY-23 TaxID=2933872 RepID=UPI001FF2B15A|nr:hypothetical protein [Ectobacillus sp. JY-23]UOY91715.1 hypothetical protein MUG87_14610 [Ectobacillus sp. JY-23]